MPNTWIKYGESIGAIAEAAITLQYACVKLGTAAGTVIQTAGAGEITAIGFINEAAAPAINDTVTVYISGIVWAQSSAAIAAGAICAGAAGGKIVTAGAGEYTTCKALEAAGGADEWIAVMIIHGIDHA
jgi:hypothetical protein